MLQYAHGRIQWLTTDILGTIYDITTNFEPKAIRLYWVGLQSTATSANSQAVAERRGVGFIANNGGTLTRSCVGTFSADNSGNADCGSIWSNTACVITVAGTGTKDGALDINAVDSLGFQLIVDDVTPANITVFYEAWGGDEIRNVTIGAISEPAATGNQTYTATGFEPTASALDQCVMFAGVQTVNATDVGQAQDSGLHVGFTTSTLSGNNITVCGNSDDGSATMDTDGYHYTGECLSMITIAGGNPNARATLSSFGTDQFTLNWIARATTNRRSIYMAIKGGSWYAGSFFIFGNDLNGTGGTGQINYFTDSIGCSLIGSMKVQTAVGVSTVNDRIGFGSGGYQYSTPTTLTQNSAAVLDEDATANSEIDTSLSTTEILVYPSVTGTLQTAYTLTRMIQGFSIRTTVAGGVPNEWVGYLYFGSFRNKPVSIGHPFIC